MSWCEGMKAETAAAPGETQTARGREGPGAMWRQMGLKKLLKPLQCGSSVMNMGGWSFKNVGREVK